jgi:hypothetical protein
MTGFSTIAPFSLAIMAELSTVLEIIQGCWIAEGKRDR